VNHGTGSAKQQMTAWQNSASTPYTPFVRSDSKLEPSDYPALAAFDIKVDRKSKFLVLLLAIITICRTIANARFAIGVEKGAGYLSVTARLG
jgi:hypothetical protein